MALTSTISSTINVPNPLANFLPPFFFFEVERSALSNNDSSGAEAPDESCIDLWEQNASNSE